MTYASRITQRSGSYSGKGMLTSELIIGFVLVGIRIVGDFETVTVPTATGNNVVTRGKVLHPAGTYGPFPVAVGLVLTFFLLSFLAAGGGTRAKFAVIFGGTVILALGVKSLGTNANPGPILKVANTIGKIGTISELAPTGTEASNANANTGSAATTSTSSTSPTSTSPTAASTAENLQQRITGIYDHIINAGTDISNALGVPKGLSPAGIAKFFGI